MNEATLGELRERPTDERLHLRIAEAFRNAGDAPRARFIELQCDRARDKVRDAEALELLARHEVAWLADSGLVPGEARWTRGFVTKVVLSPARLLAVHEAVRRTMPVRHLRLRNLDGDASDTHVAWELVNPRYAWDTYGYDEENEEVLEPPSIALSALLDLPLFEQLSGLDLSWQVLWADGGGGDALAADIARADRLMRLRYLSLADTDVTAEGARYLAAATHLRSLRLLNLDGCPIGVEGAVALLRASHLEDLRSLDLEGIFGDELVDDEKEIWPTVLKALADASHLRSLRRLRIGVDDENATHLTSASHLASVRSLSVRARGGASVLALPHWRALRALDVRQVEEPGAFAPPALGLPMLRSLRLETRLGPAGTRALAPSFAPSLRRLDLSRCGLGDDGARVLAEAPSLPDLEVLALAGNGIGPEGARALAGTARLRNLRELDLSANALGPSGAEALASTTSLPALRSLDLADNALGGGGVAALKRMTGLTRLDVTFNGLAADAPMDLQPTAAIVDVAELVPHAVENTASSEVGDAPPTVMGTLVAVAAYRGIAMEWWDLTETGGVTEPVLRV
jgi:hypothetical protein